MFNLEVNGQKASHVEMAISPFVKDIKVSLKIYASVECGGITCLESKTKEYLFQKDCSEAFMFFIDKLSEELDIKKGLLRAKLQKDYDSLYERVVDLRVSILIIVNQETSEISVRRQQDPYTTFLKKDSNKIEMTSSEIL